MYLFIYLSIYFDEWGGGGRPFYGQIVIFNEKLLLLDSEAEYCSTASNSSIIFNFPIDTPLLYFSWINYK